MWEGGSCTVAYARINASDTYGGQEGGDGDEQDTDEQDEKMIWSVFFFVYYESIKRKLNKTGI